jgi:hypothetical protein
MKRIFQVTAMFIACILAACAIQTTQRGDGGATETVNARVIISDSTVTVNITSDTAALADIMIFGEDYNPIIKSGFCDSMMAISAGHEVTFRQLSGKYNVIIINRLTETSLAINSISAGPAVSDTITDTLSASGALEGNVFYNNSFNTEKPLIRVYLRGTPYHAETDTSGAFQIGAIPQGAYFIKSEVTLFTNDINPKSNRSVGRDVEIKSSMTTTNVTLFFSE